MLAFSQASSSSELKPFDGVLEELVSDESEGSLEVSEGPEGVGSVVVSLLEVPEEVLDDSGLDGV